MTEFMTEETFSLANGRSIILQMREDTDTPPAGQPTAQDQIHLLEYAATDNRMLFHNFTNPDTLSPNSGYLLVTLESPILGRVASALLSAPHSRQPVIQEWEKAKSVLIGYDSLCIALDVDLGSLRFKIEKEPSKFKNISFPPSQGYVLIHFEDAIFAYDLSGSFRWQYSFSNHGPEGISQPRIIAEDQNVTIEEAEKTALRLDAFTGEMLSEQQPAHQYN